MEKRKWARFTQKKNFFFRIFVFSDVSYHFQYFPRWRGPNTQNSSHTTQRRNKSKNVVPDERTNERTDERTNGRTNERTDEHNNVIIYNLAHGARATYSNVRTLESTHAWNSEFFLHVI